ncbi:MAG: SPFH domain-containing protein [Bacteroidales bacterium]|nr:SPFH domain-containing protein [Bacteroidales bacterium]
MGIFNKLRNEFIDIIEWVDSSTDTIIWKFPRYENEIKNGAQLTVRESQVAILVNKGQIADVYKPGLHRLTTDNMPILTTLMGWKYGFNSPFKVDVYFVNIRQFTNRKWGTKNPIMLRDAEFGPVRLRAFGSYCFKIQEDASKFFKTIAGTNPEFKTEDIEEQLRNLIVTRFTDFLAESKIPALDLAANYNELSGGISDVIAKDFDEYGIDVTKFLIENISLPEEVEKALDKRTSMGVVGDMGKYTQFQFANSLEASAEGGGHSMASDAMGLAMGMGVANQMMSQQNMGMQQQQQQNTGNQAAPPPIPGQEPYFIAVNGQQQGPFTPNVLQQMANSGQINKDTLAWKQGMSGWEALGTIPALNSIFSNTPPPIPNL